MATNKYMAKSGKVARTGVRSPKGNSAVKGLGPKPVINKDGRR